MIQLVYTIFILVYVIGRGKIRVYDSMVNVEKYATQSHTPR